MTTCYCARLLHGGFYCPGKAPTGPRHYWEGQVQIWWSNSWPQHPPESHPPVTIGSFRKRWVAGSKVRPWVPGSRNQVWPSLHLPSGAQPHLLADRLNPHSV